MRVRHSLSLAPILLVCGVSLAPAQDVSARYYDLIRNNDLAALRSFVKTAGPNAADPRGTTPLMYAASAGSLEAMRILVDSGADVNARNAFGAAALHWSASDTGKARLLVAKGADINARSKLGRTPLWLAASYDGGSEIVRLLLEKGADANAADTFQATPLLAAARANDIDTLRLLLGKGADVNAKDSAGSTPLQFAAGWGNVEAMRLLLARGADVNAAGAPEFDPPVKNGPIALGSFTPLLLAAAYGGPPAVKLLLDSGAAVNAQDVRGMTPLMLAIASDHAGARVVRLLLSKGADPNLKSKDGENALDWARKFNRPDILPLLGLKAERAAAPAAAVPALSRPPLSPKEAVDKSVALLARTGDSFLQSGGCVACHAQNLTGLAVDAAHANVPAAQLKAVKLQWTGFEQPLLQRLDPPGAADMLEYSLLQMAAGQLPAGNVTDAMIFNLAAQQTRAGNWHFIGIARPPMQDGDFSRTALAIRSLQLYGSAGRKAEFEERIRRAAAWLASAGPRTTEDRAMQLLGLKWANGSVNQNRLHQLIALQDPSGGWPQTPELEADAYATGQVLFTLHELGTPASDPVYTRGAAFLLRTQLDDGSWRVVSRAPRFQPYFQSGFPHDHDQWISSAATAWAAMGLAYALPQSSITAELR